MSSSYSPRSLVDLLNHWWKLLFDANSREIRVLEHWNMVVLKVVTPPFWRSRRYFRGRSRNGSSFRNWRGNHHHQDLSTHWWIWWPIEGPRALYRRIYNTKSLKWRVELWSHVFWINLICWVEPTSPGGMFRPPSFTGFKYGFGLRMYPFRWRCKLIPRRSGNLIRNSLAIHSTPASGNANPSTNY